MISTPAPNPIKRVGILFSGGPAPAANAVISAAASSLRRSGRDVVAIKHGYGALMQFDRTTRPLVPGEDYDEILDRELRGLRHQSGAAKRADAGNLRRLESHHAAAAVAAHFERLAGERR